MPKTLVQSPVCTLLRERLTDLSIAYSAAVRAGNGEAARSLLSDIQDLDRELWANGCIDGPPPPEGRP